MTKGVHSIQLPHLIMPKKLLTEAGTAKHDEAAEILLNVWLCVP